MLSKMREGGSVEVISKPRQLQQSPLTLPNCIQKGFVAAAVVAATHELQVSRRTAESRRSLHERHSASVSREQRSS
jgi:hypothetical protein